jgi:hypothetical protein
MELKNSNVKDLLYKVKDEFGNCILSPIWHLQLMIARKR